MTRIVAAVALAAAALGAAPAHATEDPPECVTEPCYQCVMYPCYPSDWPPFLLGKVKEILHDSSL
jgi:hypothetical protein